MCITKVEAWSFDGKTYATEAHAIHAAVGKIVSNEALAKQVLNHASDLIPLLERFAAMKAEKLAATPTATATEVTSEKATGEPMESHDG